AEARAAERAAERAANDRSELLPASGAKGADALRQYLPFKLPPHKATSDVLAGAYPFLAEAGLGSDGIYVGQDSYAGSAFVFDPWVLYAKRMITNPNVLVAGSVGSGKSSLGKSLATRSIAFGRKVYVPGDPKGEWTPVARAVGGQAIVLGGSSSARLNPLDEGPRPAHTPGPDGALVPMSDEQWVRVVTSRRRDLLRALAAAALGRPLTAPEATALYAALETATAENTVVLLPQVVKAMFEPRAAVEGSSVEQLLADGRDAGHALNRLVAGDLGGLFDGPSTTAFDPSLPMVSLDVSQIQGADELIALVQTCAAAWMEAAFTDPNGGQRWVIYDEAWRLFRFPALLARMQAQWKLSRALGIANMAVMHRLSDLEAVGDEGSEARNLALGLLADCSTRIIYAHEPGEADKTGARIGLTASEIGQLPHLDQGEGLWKIRDRAFLVRNVLTPGELELFSTDARMTTPTQSGPYSQPATAGYGIDLSGETE
ncbi:ATP-binding protein, partial [Nocardioides hankookensis]